MSFEPQEQLKSFLEKSRDVLVVLPENPSGDAVASASAFCFFLENIGLAGTMAMSQAFPEKLKFLKQPENIISDISGARDFVLSFGTRNNNIIDIRTERKENTFNIYVTPEHGTINPKDFSFILAKFKYDLIVVIDSPDLEKLGAIYEKNSDLFFEVPVVNIDHESDNDNFGQINLVDVTASSCSEIIYGLMKNINPEALNPSVVQSLLTGIIIATDSFQKKNTTPKSLLAAAELMEKGADQQEIVRWLYKTQPLRLLKLWGRIMAKINWEESARLAWATIGVEDFVQSRSNPADLPQILEKFQENYSEGKVFMLAYNDTPATSVALVYVSEKEELARLNKELGGRVASSQHLEMAFQNSNLDEVGELLAARIVQLK
jgi:nanoRNase/pAp phosphatase (c-di-AMP/oligoRNAs hydrolase)